jgi:Mg-chelatase subunit ChlD
LSGDLPPGLALSSAGQISGIPISDGLISFTIKVEDSQSTSTSDTKNLSITIIPPPSLSITTGSLTDGLVGSDYNAILQATGGLPPYAWSILSGDLPPGLILSSAGQIFGTPTSDGIHDFTVHVEDSRSPGSSDTKSLSISIDPPPPLSITTSNLPDGLLGNIYDITLQAIGGLPPYTWSLLSGDLPLGLTLSSAGQISGIPASNGIYDFTVQVEDSQSPGTLNTKMLSIKINTPEPILNLITQDIDYGEVEVEYRFRKAIKIKNEGNAVLNFWLTVIDSADPDEDQFDFNLNEPLGFTVGIGETEYIDVAFAPTEERESNIDLFIYNANIDGWSDKPVSERTIHLHGIGVPPIPLSTMMVIDRSGSMSGRVGEDRKIEAASIAGIRYTLLLHDDYDWFGITRYNQTSETIVDLAPISDNKIEAQEKLLDIEGVLGPAGSTCIGCGMVTASEQYDMNQSAPSDHQAMIVLTDGKENVHPYIQEVKEDIKNTYENLQIFCVGIGDPIETGEYGNEGIESSKLQIIADEFDGLYKIIQTLNEEHIYDLESFYFKVFAKAKGHQIVHDPTYWVYPSNQLYEIAEVNIAECDRMADFFIISERMDYMGNIKLQDPTGAIINPSSTVGSVGVHIKDWENTRLIRIKFPPRSESDSYSGPWKLLLKPIQENKSLVIANPVVGVTKRFRVAFMAAVGSDYRMKASVTMGRISVNQAIHLGAELTEAWWPAPNGIVSVDITCPDGAIIHHVLHDDGYHSDGLAGDAQFGVDFTAHQKGYYEFLFRGIGQTERGETIFREEQLVKYVSGTEIFPDVRRFQASFHVGAANPLGDLNTLSDANIHIRLGGTYEIIDNWQLMTMIGLSQFTAEWDQGIEHPRWINFSLNLKKLFNVPSYSGLQIYLQGGPGYYTAKSGLNKFGFNFGTGAQIPIRKHFGLEFGADYNYIFTDDATMFITYQLGILFR